MPTQTIPGRERLREHRARSHCRFVLPLIHFIPYSLTYSVPLFLKRQCYRTLHRRGEHYASGVHHEVPARSAVVVQNLRPLARCGGSAPPKTVLFTPWARLAPQPRNSPGHETHISFFFWGGGDYGNPWNCLE
jgi:hypothetical protein